MAKAPSSRVNASTPCTICCQLSETSFDSCGTVASEISGSDMSGRGRFVVLVSQVVFLQSLTRTHLKTERLGTLSSLVRGGFSTVRKMMSGRSEVSNVVAQAIQRREGITSFCRGAPIIAGETCIG